MIWGKGDGLTGKEWEVDLAGHALLFGDGDGAVLDFGPAGFAERLPAVLAGGLAEFGGMDVGVDEVGDFVIEDEEFVEGDAAAGALVVAFFAALADGGMDLVWRELEGPGHFLTDVLGDSGVGLEAMSADTADEALGDGADEGGADEEGFDAHFEEAGDGGDAVVGMEGREDEVAGLGGADGDFGGFRIADFADEDDIGVMAEDGAEAAGEGQADIVAGLDLGDAFELVFDGVFDGDDFALSVVGVGEGGVEGGGFT
ncbi:MAG: hypothetical protein RI897_4361 [Verrucomicrobiota bacterium]